MTRQSTGDKGDDDGPDGVGKGRWKDVSASYDATRYRMVSFRYKHGSCTAVQLVLLHYAS